MHEEITFAHELDSITFQFHRFANVIKTEAAFAGQRCFEIFSHLVLSSILNRRMLNFVPFNFRLQQVQLTLKWVSVTTVLLFACALFMQAQQVESTARLDFIWKQQVYN